MIDDEKMTVKVLNKMSGETTLHMNLNDALSTLDEDITYEVTALLDVSCYLTITVPPKTELVIPSNIRFMPDIDASINILGALRVDDQCALVGEFMVSLYIAPDARLMGEGLSARSNFYKHDEKTAAETDACYHWDPVNEYWVYVD